MIKSFKGKLLFWTGLTFLITLLFINLLVYFSLKSYLYEKIDTRLNDECTELSEVVYFQQGKIVLSDSSEWTEAEHTEFGEHSIYLQIFSPHGETILRSKNLEKKDISYPFLDVPKGALVYSEYEYQQHVFRIARLKRTDRDPAPEILAAYEISDTISFLTSVKLSFAIITPLILIISMIGIGFITSKAFSPIQRITQIAQNILKSGNLQQTIKAEVRDTEISNLIGTLNALFQKLDFSLNQIKNFSADASHELRTPLTIMRGQIEVLLKRERNKEEYKAALVSAHEEVLKMTNIINNLFQLARVDNGKFNLEMSIVRLDELAALFDVNAKNLVAEKCLKYTSKIEKGIDILGNKEALQEVFLNIMDNAVKYNKTNGSIDFSLKANNKNVIIEFSDTGIGISPEEQDKIFERFYRVDKARSRKMGGSGLGLAIVKWIINEHNGRIELESELGKGTTFRILLPRLEYEI